MPIADWEKNINDAYVAQGLSPYYKESDASSPWEASGGDNSKYLQLLQQSGAIPANYSPGQSSGGIPQIDSGYGMGGSPAPTGGANPYLSGVADDIGRRSNMALGQAFNGIRSNAVGVGGLGGSRQGAAEGQAIGMAQDSLQGNLANLYGSDWTNQQNRDLQNRGLDVTMRGQDIGWQNTQRQLDQSGAALGSNLETQQINNGWLPLLNAGNVYSQFGGFGSTSNSTNAGGGISGLAGGLLGGAQLSNNLGWWK